MTIADALQQLILGAALGALGQGIRAVVGLKKVYEGSTTSGQPLSRSGFDGARLGISLTIGAIVGGLSVFLLTGFKAVDSVDQSLIFKLITVGYAGTDVVEGFLKRYLIGQYATPLAIASPDVDSSQVNKSYSLSLADSSLQNSRPKKPLDAAKQKVDPSKALEIELAVCAHVFPPCLTKLPDGELRIDPKFSIADACNAAPGNIAEEVDTYADELSRANSVTWKPQVVAADVSGLKTIQNLIDLIGKHLS